MENSLWLHRLALLTAFATFVLIFVGGLVTSTGSGLSVPDWPLSYGGLFPPMKGGVVYEHTHRMIAALVGILTMSLAIWIYFSDRRPTVRWLGLAALMAVMLQGLLGGMTVLLSLPTAISVAHACLGQAFLCLIVALAFFTSPKLGEVEEGRPEVETHRFPLANLCVVAVGLLYIQLILGALMRHMGAGLAISDFPLAFGRLIPPIYSREVLVHFLHRLGAVAVSISVIWVAWRIAKIKRHRQDPLLFPFAIISSILLIFQIFLGAFTIWTQRSVIPATSHVLVGAALLTVNLTLALRSYRVDRKFISNEAVN